MTQNYDRLGGFSFKSLISLRLNTKILEQFHREIPVYTKSKTIQYFIKQFLDKIIILRLSRLRFMPRKLPQPKGGILDLI